MIHRDCKKHCFKKIIVLLIYISLQVRMNKYIKLLQTAELPCITVSLMLDWCNFICFENHKIPPIIMLMLKMADIFVNSHQIP